MALSTLALVFNIVGALRKRPQIGTITVDTHLSEDHSYSSSITTSEIEDGSPINDHVIDEPFRLSVNGYISNITTIGIGIASAVITGTSVLSGKNKAKDAERELRALRTNKVPFSIVTGLRSYKNMMITSLSFPRSSVTGKGLEFNATFQQVTIVQSQVLAISSEDQKLLQRRSDEGRKQAKEASEKQASITSEGVKRFNKGLLKQGRNPDFTRVTK